MIVIILENVKPALRGELSRWLFEIKSGVFT
ncbi:type I-E CRISPR-associated endoribonuclease Cas2e, partial [Parathermosynechococcus lividus]